MFARISPKMAVMGKSRLFIIKTRLFVTNIKVCYNNLLLISLQSHRQKSSNFNPYFSRSSLWTQNEWGECSNNCSGNGICNSNGNCHCDDKFGGISCDERGYGGSIDSNRANYMGKTSKFSHSRICLGGRLSNRTILSNILRT